MKRERKTATLNIRTVPGVRDMITELADADHTSIAQTIEKLIREETARKARKAARFEEQDDANAHHGHSRRRAP